MDKPAVIPSLEGSVLPSKYTFKRVISDFDDEDDCTLEVEDVKSRDRVAIKALGLRSDAAKYQRYVHRILSCLPTLLHPHIIALQDVFVMERHVGIVMELPKGPSLKSFVDTVGRGKGLEEDTARNLFVQILLAIDFCHQLAVAIRNINVETVLLKNPMVPGRAPTLKLYTLGSTINEHYSTSRTVLASAPCQAPEVLEARGGSYDPKAVDVWGVGVVLYYMLCGRAPFTAEGEGPGSAGQKASIKRMRTGEFLPPSKKVSSEVVHLLQRILDPDPAQRITVAEICSHAWVCSGEWADKDITALNDQYLKAAAKAAAAPDKESKFATVIKDVLQQVATKVGEPESPCKRDATRALGDVFLGDEEGPGISDGDSDEEDFLS